MSVLIAGQFSCRIARCNPVNPSVSSCSKYLSITGCEVVRLNASFKKSGINGVI